MSKDKYKRTNVHSDLLAKVIFRVDVAGLTDLTGYINRVKGLDLIKKSFNRILPLKSRSVSFVIDAQNSENSKFTQNSEIDNGFRFLDCTIEEGSKAVLDIVNDSINPKVGKMNNTVIITVQTITQVLFLEYFSTLFPSRKSMYNFLFRFNGLNNNCTK